MATPQTDLVSEAIPQAIPTGEGWGSLPPVLIDSWADEWDGMRLPPDGVKSLREWWNGQIVGRAYELTPQDQGPPQVRQGAMAPSVILP